MKIAVFGAGSTGCYLGGLLSLADNEVTLICRPRIKDMIEQAGGLTLTDFEGQHEQLMPSRLITEVTDDTNMHFDIVLVTLKCHHLISAQEDLVKLSQGGAKLIFMQNGLGSLELISEQLPPEKVLQGITPFNVLSKEQATFHRGTEGAMIFQRCPETKALKQQFEALGFPCELYDDMRPAIYGKLLMNLNNAINAIADLPIKTQLQNRRCRKVLAGAMKEWLAVASASGVNLIQYTAIKPSLVPYVLALPNLLFEALAKKMIAIDPEARSSMWEDIQAGRKTEIEFLNGAVADLAQETKIPAPINHGISQLVTAKEQGESVTLEQLFALLS